MKIHYRILCFAMAAFAMLAVGCQKEEDTVTLGAETQRPANADTKVYIDDHTPCWHNGDQIFINNASYPIISATGSSARIQEVSRHDTYRAVFPASIVSGTNISNSASVPVTLPVVQQYQMVGDHQRVDVPMGAYLTSGSTLQFHNLCSVVRVTVNNNMNNNIAVRAISLTASQARLSGRGTATVSGQASDRIAMSTSGSHTVTLAMPEANPVTIGALESKAFDIVVPSFTTDDITIKVHTTEGYAYTTKSSVGLVNNTITTASCPVVELLSYGHADLVSGTAFNSAIPSRATSIVFECNNSASSGTVLSTADSPVPIYGRLEGSVWHVCTIADTIDANPDCSRMFCNNSSLASIVFGSGFNTANVTNMMHMFYNCSSLTSLNVSNFNTANVRDMSEMFYGCESLTSLNLSSFNTANVTNMSAMFNGCSSLTSLDLSNFNTANVTNMSAMFNGCSSLTSLDLSNFNTTHVTSMAFMFSECSILASLNLSHFNTSCVTDMGAMFYGCSSLLSIDLSSFNTNRLTKIVGLRVVRATYGGDGDEDYVQTPVDTAFMGLFEGCSSLSTIDLSNFNTSNITAMTAMFRGCSSLTTINLTSFNTSNVTDMGAMFYGCSSLTNLDLSNFNTSNVQKMTYAEPYLSSYAEDEIIGHAIMGMFGGCSSLTSLNLSSFYTSNVNDMRRLFSGCSNLISLNLSNFNLSHSLSWIHYGDPYISGDGSGISGMCFNLSTISENCTIICPLSVETNMKIETSLWERETNLYSDDGCYYISCLPTTGVTFTWVRP